MVKSDLELLLGNINDIIEIQHTDVKNVGVFSGLSGVALFQFYYSKYLSLDDLYNTTIDKIGECISIINDGYIYPTFCDGICGLSWVLDHLKEQGSIDLETIDLEIFDTYLYNCMLEDIKKKNYDYLHGTIGYANYFLERFKNTSKEKRSTYKNYLVIFINFIEDTSIQKDDGVLWLTRDIETGLEIYNLSLSHGVASIIAILQKLCFLEDFEERCEGMLKKAVTEVLKYKNNISNCPSYFPNWISISSQDHFKNSRLAWCYGDLGIGLQLLYTSKTLKDTDLYLEALEILLHCTSRKDPEDTLIDDGAICHGAFGVALVFNNIYKNTGRLEFKQSRDYWLARGVEFLNSDSKLLAPVKDGEKEISILNGLAGIGLTIISCLSDLNEWEKSLMLNYYE